MEATYAEGMARGLRESLADDPRVFLMGQYFFGLTRHRSLTVELRDAFPERVWDPPIAEVGYVGTGIGAAISGLRPIVDVATASFIFQAFSQVVNEAANIRYMTGGQTAVPLVIHINHGVRGGGAAQHSHSPQAMLMNTPGLQIVTPSTPRDVRGLIRAAVESDDPVIWADHVRLFDVTGELPDEPETIPLGVADVKREGGDVTVVAIARMVHQALEAAETLAAEGIEVEVVDPRWVSPFDWDTVEASLAKTNRLVVVHEAVQTCGFGAEVAARAAERGFWHLDGPVVRVTAPDCPKPSAPTLEAAAIPDAERIARGVRQALAGAAPDAKEPG